MVRARGSCASVTSKTSQMHLETAKLFLERESLAADTALGKIAAAEQVYAAIFDCLAPIIGGAGVEALFLRSIKLASGQHPSLGALRQAEPKDPTRNGAASLRALGSLDPILVGEATASVYSKFLDLLATLIGERLVTQVLITAFPQLSETQQEND